MPAHGFNGLEWLIQKSRFLQMNTKPEKPKTYKNYLGEETEIGLPFDATAILQSGDVFLYVRENPPQRKFLVSYGLQVKTFQTLEKAGFDFDACVKRPVQRSTLYCPSVGVIDAPAFLWSITMLEFMMRFLKLIPKSP